MPGYNKAALLMLNVSSSPAFLFPYTTTFSVLLWCTCPLRPLYYFQRRSSSYFDCCPSLNFCNTNETSFEQVEDCARHFLHIPQPSADAPVFGIDMRKLWPLQTPTFSMSGGTTRFEQRFYHNWTMTAYALCVSRTQNVANSRQQLYLCERT
jgi:hypothetical protein